MNTHGLYDLLMIHHRFCPEVIPCLTWIIKSSLGVKFYHKQKKKIKNILIFIFLSLLFPFFHFSCKVKKKSQDVHFSWFEKNTISKHWREALSIPKCRQSRQKTIIRVRRWCAGYWTVDTVYSESRQRAGKFFPLVGRTVTHRDKHASVLCSRFFQVLFFFFFFF